MAHLTQKELLTGKYKKRVKWPKPFTRWPWVPSGFLASHLFKDSKWLWAEKQLSDNPVSFPTSDTLQFWVYLVISDETCQYFPCFSNLQFFWCLMTLKESQGWVGAGWLSEKAGSLTWQPAKVYSNSLDSWPGLKGCLALQQASYPGTSPAHPCVSYFSKDT